MDVVLSFPEYDVEYIMKIFFSKRQISEIITGYDFDNKIIRTTNYYLDFIV